MHPCPEEELTQHYCPSQGFGPVNDNEEVVFAIFVSTARDDPLGELTAKSFEESHLKRGSLSLIRASCTTRSEFETTVVTPSLDRKGALIGVASANVATLRSLVCAFTLNNGSSVAVRGLCITDLVVAVDCDGHAAAGYCHSSVPKGVGQTTLGQRRSQLRLNMALSFSKIKPPDSIKWPSMK